MRVVFAAALVITGGCLVENESWDGEAETSSNDSGDSGGALGLVGVEVREGCPPSESLLNDPPQVVLVTPDQAASLHELVGSAEANTAFVLADGVYDRTGQPSITVSASDTVIRSMSGDPASVIIRGENADASLIRVKAANTRIAELTVTGNSGALVILEPAFDTLSGTMIYRVIFGDSGNVKLQASANPGSNFYVQDTTVACSEFRMSAEFRGGIVDCNALAAITAAGTRGFTLRDSLVEGHWCHTGNKNAAVRLSDGARDTVVERNVFRDNYRAVILGGDPETAEAVRNYEDINGCATATPLHVEATVENNIFWVGSQEMTGAEGDLAADAMLSFWAACGVLAQHNTVVNLFPIFSGIEYRFPDTKGTIANNLVTANLLDREAGEIDNKQNVDDAPLAYFEDAQVGDVHLSADAVDAIDAAIVLSANPVTRDFEGDVRDDFPDIGADERAN